MNRIPIFNLSRYQIIINSFCGFTIKENSQDLLLFNLTSKSLQAQTDVTKQRYLDFLSFCVDSMKDFKEDPKNLYGEMVYKSYHVSNLTEEEKRKFEEISANYSSKYNASPPEFNGGFPNDRKLYEFNERVIDEFMADKKYNTHSELKIASVLGERVSELETCLARIAETSTSTPPRKIKRDREARFYRDECVREKRILEEVDRLIIENELIPADGRLYQDLSAEEKKKTVLGYMADRIQYGPNGLYSFNSESETIDEIISKLLTDIKAINDRLIRQSLIKRLMTFLPLKLFNVAENPANPTDPSNFSINDEEFTAFLKKEGVDQNNFKQYRLGLNRDLLGRDVSDDEREVRNFMTNALQLWHTNSVVLDLYNPCGKYVDWNIYLNLFCVYMYGRSGMNSGKVFPLSFSLSNYTSSSYLTPTFNSSTESYSFRTRQTYLFEKIFPNPSIKFLGVHLIKYYRKGKLVLFPLVTFIDIGYEHKSVQNRNEEDFSVGGELNIYTGKIRETYTFDSKYYFVEGGEITPELGITHHEFYNALYYKLRPYIMDGKKDQLYFTMRQRDDPELLRLCELIGMTEVFIMKDSFPVGGPLGPKGPKRIIVKTRDEAASYNTGILIAKQTLPHVGGGRKPKNNKTLKNRKHKTTKTFNNRKHKNTKTFKNRKSKTTKTKKVNKNIGKWSSKKESKYY